MQFAIHVFHSWWPGSKCIGASKQSSCRSVSPENVESSGGVKQGREGQAASLTLRPSNLLFSCRKFSQLCSQPRTCQELPSMMVMVEEPPSRYLAPHLSFEKRMSRGYETLGPWVLGSQNDPVQTWTWYDLYWTKVRSPMWNQDLERPTPPMIPAKHM